MSVRKVESIVRPETVEAAWQARLDDPEATRFLAGGVDLVLYAPPSVTTLIDLSRLGLNRIRLERGDVVIGATATLSEVLESPLVGSVADGFLVEVLRQVASPLQRNLATIGGAAVRAHPWSDVVPALLVLDARLDAFSGQSVEREIGGVESRGDGVLPLVQAIRVPEAWLNCRAAFEKFARTAFDVALLNCACAVRLERGVCREARVVVGGTPGPAKRMPGAEDVLVGKRLTHRLAASAAATVAGAIDARDDRRASAAYRRRVAEVGVRRCLERISDQEAGA